MMATSPRMRNALTLFSAEDCVLCHRVRLVLAAKGVTIPAGSCPRTVSMSCA